MPLNHHYGRQMCRFPASVFKKKKKKSLELACQPQTKSLNCWQGEETQILSHEVAHTCTASMINTLYIAAHLQFWIINTVLWGFHTCTKHKHVHTLPHLTRQREGVHAKWGWVGDRGGGGEMGLGGRGGGANIKVPQQKRTDGDEARIVEDKTNSAGYFISIIQIIFRVPWQEVCTR